MEVSKNLFDAYHNNELPSEGGYVVSAFFDEESAYTRYDAISYANVKDMYETQEGLTFQADGAKIFMLVEPPNYAAKHIEPAHRDHRHKIPYRFKELDLFVSAREHRIYIAKEPVMTYGHFTVLRPTGSDFSLIFYRTPQILDVFETFFVESLRKEAGVPLRDARTSANAFRKVFSKIVGELSGRS